jgi:ferredoxin-NADP reductase
MLKHLAACCYKLVCKFGSHQVQKYDFFSLSLLFSSGDEVWVSDPEGTFDAMTKLSQATDFLLLAAGTGETNR